jgi:hypothetical protein
MARSRCRAVWRWPSGQPSDRVAQPLLGPETLKGRHTSGPPRRHIGRQKADGRQRERGGGERGHIGRLELKEQTASGAARGERKARSDNEPDGDQSQRLPEHEPEHISALRPQRHTYRNLAHTAGHRVGDHAVYANCREQTR